MRPLLGVLALAALLAGPAAELAAEPVPARPAPPAADRARVDEGALRYYAATRNKARVEAETRRLKRLDPAWRVPDDLWTAQLSDGDEGELWDLLAAGKLDALRREITSRRAAEPEWRPSDNLVRQLARKETRNGAMALHKNGSWPEIAALATEWGRDRDPADLEMAWIFAEALARADRSEEALGLLRGIMESPEAAEPERLATLQKALSLLPLPQAELLLALARPAELVAIAIDATRTRLSARLHGEAVRDITPAEIGAFQAYALAAADPNQAGLLAWDGFKRRDLPEALNWFKVALGRGGDAMIAHGLAHTLRRLGRARDAEEVAYAWREPLINNALLFIDILEVELTRPVPQVVEPDRLQRYGQVTMALASGEGAQALAWYAYNLCQFDSALDWFRRAAAWHPKEGTAYGLALTLRRLKRQREFIEVANRYDGLFPRVVDILFAEVRPQNPTPCDAAPAAAAERAPLRPVAATSRYLDMSSGPAADPADRMPRVPQPGDMSGGSAEGGKAPLVRRSDFPIAVVGENELRFAPSAAPAPRGPAEERWRPRGPSLVPLVARRVPGVAAMPYERFGFDLLPGWSGGTTPSSPDSAAQRPPRGTLWEEDERDSAPIAAAPADAPARPLAKLDPRARP